MKTRHKRLGFIGLGLVGVGIAATLVLGALKSNIALFLTPTEVVEKKAPVNRTIKIGGLVEKGSFKRDEDGLGGRFTITDTSKSVLVVYNGILPDLFKEGKGCVAEGKIGSDGVFHATNVLAKHDENYMPPQAGDAIDKAKASRTLVDK